MKPTAIYPGTFDPLTNGHVDIIERALPLFNKIIVACAPTSRKDPHLKLEERVDLMADILTDERIEVLPLSGLLVDFAKTHQANFILRGLRAVSDFDYEFQLTHMNYKLSSEIETIFLPAREGYSYVSGTMVREIVTLGGDVSPFVPPLVAHHLQKRREK
ncbi:pantetheine-phosphate adenylyltransferase [Coxiella endosymbiont of Ornithodoros amblus]|uniref:pantetheine-phosphate adenylyltransferase n=1 Tax=Coxiella endosymbiont of Ornithodoros amblus TaxID=1656166 RepID=UPI00244E3C68|nr:pantetheine-phosphate adenylyltransferase [Coxiella endosymbiont of Ornithodoros amblus]MBW5802992.1 pantetheine-phosphate adenylyltransferase [Coxiella endosymbiont of Ornithodoros amblus]